MIDIVKTHLRQPGIEPGAKQRSSSSRKLGMLHFTTKPLALTRRTTF